MGLDLAAILIVLVFGGMVFLAAMIDRSRRREREQMRKIRELHSEIMRLHRETAEIHNRHGR